MTPRPVVSLLSGALLAAACAPGRPAEPRLAPAAAVEELLAADRAFAAASTGRELPGALGAMFADDVAMPVRGEGFVTGRARVLATLRSDPANAGAGVGWSPIRGGVSADGQQGFTFGFMTVRRADGSVAPLKYMAYWVRHPEGWRVAVYKRAPRADGPVPESMMPPSLPARMVAPDADSAALAALGEELAAAEREFSRTAQRIGLGPAFARFGAPDAVNMGGPRSAGFVVGADSIARLVSAGEPPAGSSVWWEPHRVIVASSGDLGVTIGAIHPNAPAEGAPLGGYPFFTIWRRDAPGAPWRYVAE